jgi:hypothetical protein
MIARSLAIGLLAAGCLTAAAGGSYLAVRQNASSPADAPPAVPVTTPAPAAEPAPAVHESEAIVSPSDKPEAVESAPASEPAPRATPRAEPRVFPPAGKPARRPAPSRVAVAEPAERPQPAVLQASVSTPSTDPAAVTDTDPQRAAAPQPAPAEPAVRQEEPLFEEIVIPAASVIGLELESTITTERAQLEDRVDARVTRDVFANGRLAIPAGSRVAGIVTLVERGGKVKERARLGVRFHTLVLANGRQVPLRTETIFREGESPAGESSKKIGGAAIGGAVLGAIIGGKKGAIAGATAGAAGGTAVVMAGDRNHATLPAGSVVTVKLAAPVSFEVER